MARNWEFEVKQCIQEIFAFWKNREEYDSVDEWVVDLSFPLNRLFVLGGVRDKEAEGILSATFFSNGQTMLTCYAKNEHLTSLVRGLLQQYPIPVLEVFFDMFQQMENYGVISVESLDDIMDNIKTILDEVSGSRAIRTGGPK